MACLASRNGDMLVAFCHTITIVEEEGVSEQGTHILERPYLLSLSHLHTTLSASIAGSLGWLLGHVAVDQETRE